MQKQMVAVKVQFSLFNELLIIFELRNNICITIQKSDNQKWLEQSLDDKLRGELSGNASTQSHLV